MIWPPDYVYICFDCGRHFQWLPPETGGHMKPNGYEQCLGKVWQLISVSAFFSAPSSDVRCTNPLI